LVVGGGGGKPKTCGDAIHIRCCRGGGGGAPGSGIEREEREQREQRENRERTEREQRENRERTARAFSIFDGVSSNDGQFLPFGRLMGWWSWKVQATWLLLLVVLLLFEFLFVWAADDFVLQFLKLLHQ
jgi:hypothetical protein